MSSLVGGEKQAISIASISEATDSVSSDLEWTFNHVAQAIAQHDLSTALRYADRARRIAPKNTACVLLYAQLLTQAGFANEALNHLKGKSDPNLSLARGIALLELGFRELASQCCSDLLQQFSLGAIDGLEHFASSLCEGGDGRDQVGWIGLDDQLQLVGNAKLWRRIGIECPEGMAHPVRLVSTRAGLNSFTCNPSEFPAGKILARADDRELLGSRLGWPPNFELSAWVSLEGSNLVGEAHFGWSPELPVTLLVSDAFGSFQRVVSTRPDGKSDGWSFKVPLTPAELHSVSIEVNGILPDGTKFPVVGSPIYLRSAQVTKHHEQLKRSTRTRSQNRLVSVSGPSKVTDIIVPVFAAHVDTLICLQSVLRTTDRKTSEIIVVDDASPEPELSKALVRLSAERRITLVTNPSNLGFAGSVNQAIKLHPDRDVILLNSDTEVFGDWVERLKKSASTSAKIGTVTPMGENGSITDYSRGTPRGTSNADDIDSIVRIANASKTVEIPVGVGFCMYIKRDCIEQTGELDAATFGKGYGEENDFCLRASRLGWRHLAATDVFVAHQGARSFGKTKTLLQKRNSRVLNNLHPGYAALLGEFAAADPMLAVRRAIDIARLLNLASDAVLIVTHDILGGVKRHIDQRQAELTARGHTVLVLQRHTAGTSSLRVSLTVESLGLENLIFDVPRDVDVLEQLIRDIHFSHVEIHHLLRLPIPVIELIGALSFPFDIYIHDYSWICPRVNLIDGSGKYCGEPELAVCESCISKNGSSMEESLTVAALRQRSAKLFANARKIFVPSIDAEQRLECHFPGLRLDLTPWESLPSSSPQLQPTPAARVRVAVIGAIGAPKGYQVLLECGGDAAARNLDLEFTVIGHTLDDQLLIDTGRFFVTGPYQDEEVEKLLAREQCNVAFFPSVTPETWCYSLSHALRRGMPTVAFDLGAQAERLHNYGIANLLPLSWSASQVNAALLKVAQNGHGVRQQEEAAMNQPESSVQQRPAENVSANLESSVQVLNLPEGIYSFTVKDGGALRNGNGKLAVPALQVGIAPIACSGKVEFLNSASVHDRWLAYRSDMIVVRISGGDSSLLLTSVHMKDCPSIALDVQRLNARADFSLHDSREARSDRSGSAAIMSVRLLAHIRYVGDLSFENGQAGWPGQQMWIEGFAITSVGKLPHNCAEYRGIMSNGFETAWLNNQTLCGSRGGGLPLLGFGVRLIPEFAARYGCEYSGSFYSGSKVGPVRDGVLCSSEFTGDPLEVIDIRVYEREGLDKSSALSGGASPNI